MFFQFDGMFLLVCIFAQLPVFYQINFLLNLFYLFYELLGVLAHHGIL